jgi:hypothetical protein
MAQDTRNGPPRRDGRPGGGSKRDSFGRGAAKGPTVTYETLKELERGADYKIHKFVLADKANHTPVKTEYRLTRDGLAGTQVFNRLFDAKAAAVAPLPEPEAAAPEAAQDATAQDATAQDATAEDVTTETATESPGHEGGISETHPAPASDGSRAE